MNVKLVALTQPLIPECETAEELVAYCARVSNPANQANHNTSEKLLKYMVDNKHWSPFEMVNLAFEIVTTRDIGRQILRHRSFSFQEFSQRYADVSTLDNDSVFDTRECRFQDTKNRQNSIEVKFGDISEQETEEWFLAKQLEIQDNTLDAYKESLVRGIAKEQARCFLPEGMTKTRMYMNGTLRSWIHYCDLRMEEATQKEHRMLAKEVWPITIGHFPSLTNLLG